MLDEVEIMEKKQVIQKEEKGSYGIKPTRLVVPDYDKPKTLPEMLLGITGVKIANLGGLNPMVSIPRLAGGGPLLWVLDGIALSQKDTSFQDVMDRVAPGDVKQIELYLGAEVAMYGSRASGGVIVITIRTGEGADYVNRKEGSFDF